ncbi:Effector protein YopJ [compost metagenome]
MKISSSHLTHTALPDENASKLSVYQKNLDQCISEVKDALSSERWHTVQFGHHDARLMPGLIEYANQSTPGLNLMRALSPHVAVGLIQDSLVDGIDSGRIIVNMGSQRFHWSALDFRVLNDKISIISFESASSKYIGPAALDADLSDQFAERMQGRNYSFHTIFMDIQRSPSGCGIFSLVTAKKLHQHHDEVTRLHELNIEGKIQTTDKDTLLPPELMKHTQSKTRLAEYIDNHPGADLEEINKKNQTLMDRQKSYAKTTDEKVMITSIHEKRLNLYEKLRTFITP